jgi:DNA-binding Lrp family transcriptional regulator
VLHAASLSRCFDHTQAPTKNSEKELRSVEGLHDRDQGVPAVPNILRSLDATDTALLSALQQDARISNAQLAAHAGVAPSTALVRLRGLRRSGVIRGFRAEVDPAAVGRPVQALVAVRLRAHDRAVIDSFARRVPYLPEVVQTFHVAGADDYVLHVAVPDAGRLRDFVLDHLTTHPAVGHTETSLVFTHTEGHRGPLAAEPSS